MAKLTIIRGLPGTGKTTLAKKLTVFHVEADMFFQRGNQYCHDSKVIREAHNWCAKTAEVALRHGMDVVVSNTFVKKWEVERYLAIAEKCNANCEIIVAEGRFRNTHGVPDQVIQRMKDSWEAV